MKEKVKNILKIVLLFIVLIIPFTFFSYVRADSGWDTGYSSGGSSSSGGGGWSGSGGSSSSWSTGGSSRSRNHGYTESDPVGAVLALFIFFMVLVVVGILSSENSKRNSYGSHTNLGKYEQRYPDITDNEIKHYLPDHTLGSLKHMAYQKFLDIQNAWMEFDYEKLRELCTDELFNTYKAQLEVLKMKNQKNIMTNFNLEEIRILSIFATKEIISVEVYLRVSFYDYVVSNVTHKAVQGTKDIAITNNYKMKYVVSKDRTVNNKCPNCGAPIDTVTSKECEYCGSTIVLNSNDFVLSKKTNEKTTR